MGIQHIKDVLHLRIEQADEQFLQIIYAMVEAYAEQHQLEDAQTIVGYRAGEEPITIEALKEKIARAEQQIDDGDYLTPEQLQEESQAWLSGSTE